MGWRLPKLNIKWGPKGTNFQLKINMLRELNVQYGNYNKQFVIMSLKEGIIINLKCSEWAVII